VCGDIIVWVGFCSNSLVDKCQGILGTDVAVTYLNACVCLQLLTLSDHRLRSRVHVYIGTELISRETIGDEWIRRG
jgi:hypothetical protein